MFRIAHCQVTICCFVIALLLSCSCVQLSHAASGSPNAGGQTFLLKKINVSGSQRFAEPEIVQATGLKPGSTVTADDLKEAANRLGQSGVFSQVSYRYDGISADFTLVDAAKFVPATFENFVWFSNADLVQRIHRTVPLFNGSVPLAGSLPDQVSAALDAILKEKGVPGHTVETMGGKLGGSLEAARFQIEGVTAKISEIRFVGAAPERIPALLQATRKTAGDNYMQSFFADVIKLNAPQVYGKLGFLKAQFGPPKLVIVKDDPVQPIVAVEVPVQEGDPYSFAAANWSGAAAVPLADLANVISLQPGSPADTIRLAGDLAKAKELYGTKGYMNAQVKSTATLDSEKHTAIFNLQVTEGPLYRMGKLEVQAPDPQRAELTRKVWGMHEGDVYDAGYVRTFLKKHPAELSALNGWFLNFTQTIHDDTHVVDLSLKYEKFQRETK